MKTVAIIQARTGSTRLPGKVLMDLAGEPMLARVVNRTSRAKKVDQVIVATTELTQDQVIADLCAARNWNCFRGSENDVLDRYYQAAVTNHADIIVRITADCPLINPEVVDQVVAGLISSPNIDYVANILPRRTFPRGLDTEAFRFQTLERLWHEDKDPVTREHVTAHLHKNLNAFRTAGLLNGEDLSDWRLTVDTEDDFALIKKIYDHFRNDSFIWDELRSFIVQHKDWLAINAHVQQKVI